MSMSMYTEQEVTNIELNKQEQILTIFGSARVLANHYMAVRFSEAGMGFKIAEEMIVRGFCTIHMAHMDVSDFEEMLTNTLAYFATGLYDCEKLQYFAIKLFNVVGWQYTDATHNNAGYWFDIWKFEKDYDAEKCVAMLKAIGAELEKLHKN